MPIILRLFGTGCILAGLMHVIFGIGADMMLGADISASTRLDPSIDSQNRFYGATFTLYGLIFWKCSSDIDKYEGIILTALACFFFGGLARIVSIILVGWPEPAILFLLATEIILPPLLWLGIKHSR